MYSMCEYAHTESPPRQNMENQVAFNFIVGCLCAWIAGTFAYVLSIIL